MTYTSLRTLVVATAMAATPFIPLVAVASPTSPPHFKSPEWAIDRDIGGSGAPTCYYLFKDGGTNDANSSTMDQNAIEGPITQLGCFRTWLRDTLIPLIKGGQDQCLEWKYTLPSGVTYPGSTTYASAEAAYEAYETIQKWWRSQSSYNGRMLNVSCSQWTRLTDESAGQLIDRYLEATDGQLLQQAYYGGRGVSEVMGDFIKKWNLNGGHTLHDRNAIMQKLTSTACDTSPQSEPWERRSPCYQDWLTLNAEARKDEHIVVYLQQLDQYFWNRFRTIVRSYDNYWSVDPNDVLFSRKYFSDSCKVLLVPPGDPDPLNVCAEVPLYFWSSPISLLWESDTTIGEDLSLISFPLNPRSQDQYVVWKASERFPLLVHDPAKTGVVKSGAELFGNYTFGDKQAFAGPQSLISHQGDGKVWAHGYEALGTLDADSNGVVTGEELAPLSLWFDRNQDGISQEGEVVDLRKMGVTKLRYTNTHKEANGDVYVDNGFERIVNGTTITGTTVDWYTPEASSKAAALALLKDQAEQVKALRGSASPDQKAAAPQENTVTAVSPETSHPRVGGIWRFSIDDNKGKQPEGVLILEETTQGVRGRSIVETPVRYGKVAIGSSTIRSVMLQSILTGIGRTLPNGERMYDVTLRSKESDTPTKTQMFLSKDGKTLRGKTSVVVPVAARKGENKQKTNRAGKVEYTWSARRGL